MRSAVCRLALIAAVTLAVQSSPLLKQETSASAADNLPTRLSDADYSKLISDLSEPTAGETYPGGDNFTTNEPEYQYVIPELMKVTPPGGVYFGVAPEQNFTYIAALRPKIAFIIDIRRQNMMEHLLYKALFEEASNRANFLSLLFDRKRPNGLTAESTVQELFSAYANVPSDRALHDANLKMIKERLTQRHGFQLEDDLIAKLEHVAQGFFQYGPRISFSNRGGGVNGPFPSYAELLTQNDGRGTNRSFLASEASFHVVKDLEEKNLIVPVVGDFTDEKTMRATGAYVRSHGATVSTIYASTVEYILMMPPRRGAPPTFPWKKYYENLAMLPTTPSTMLIRDAVLQNGLGAPLQDAMVVQSVADLVSAYRAGKISGLTDLMHLSKCGSPASVKYGCRP
jgi:hypothetical protein